MTILIAGIAFDHQRGLAEACTVPLRYDAVNSVLLPEWQYGQVLPSVAAYAIDRLPGLVSVFVRLNASADEPREVELRALAQPMVGSYPPPAPLLGDLGPQTVTFEAGGDSGWRRFAFSTDALAFGVDVATIQWRWQFRRHPLDAWKDLDLTSHRIYALLSTPKEPWLLYPTKPTNTSLPRTDMLDFACLWARGARDPMQAAARITEAVNRLGGLTFRYDSAVGAPHYTVLAVPRFLCDEFLDRLRGGFGAGPLVNCSDCATIVSTFANLVGADLWQSKMGLVGLGFRLNPILAIGSSHWSTLSGYFGFHEVAWANACTEDDLVFDACVQLDRDLRPERAPHSAELPAGLQFGRQGDGQYRDRIAAPDGRDECLPQPALRIRRAVGQGIALPPRWPAGLSQVLAKRVGLDLSAVPADTMRFEGFLWFGGELPGWLLTSSAVFDAPGRPRLLLPEEPAGTQIASRARVVVSTWRSAGHPQALLRLESIETSSGAEARHMLLDVAADIQNPGMQPWERGVEGETAWMLGEGTLVLFTRANHLHVVRSAGLEPIDVRAEVQYIDDWLVSAGVSAGEAVAPPVSTSPYWKRWQLGTYSAGFARIGVREAERQFTVTPFDARDWTSKRS